MKLKSILARCILACVLSLVAFVVPAAFSEHHLAFACNSSGATFSLTPAAQTQNLVYNTAYFTGNYYPCGSPGDYDRFVWHWGDNSAPQGYTVCDGNCPNPVSQNTTHDYQSTGTFYVYFDAYRCTFASGCAPDGSSPTVKVYIVSQGGTRAS